MLVDLTCEEDDPVLKQELIKRHLPGPLVTGGSRLGFQSPDLHPARWRHLGIGGQSRSFHHGRRSFGRCLVRQVGPS